MRQPSTAVLAAAALWCGVIAQPPPPSADTTPGAAPAPVAAPAEEPAPAVQPTWTPVPVGQPWYPIPYLPVDSWNPYA